MFSDLITWLKDNWYEESNVGKAKLAALAVLIFLLIASLLPGSEPPAPTQAVATSGEAADTAPGPERAARESYDGSGQAAGGMAREQVAAEQAAAKEAAEAYQAYETRIAELEQEKAALEKEAAQQAAEAYRSYETRIGELEHERESLAGKMADIDRAEQEAAAAYQSYESRVAALERENEALRKRIRELEATAPAVDPDLRLKLEALRGTLDQILATLPPPAD